MPNDSTWRELVSDAVLASLKQAQDKNKQFSLRAYARRYSVPVSTLSELLKKKPAISKLKAAELIERLPLVEREKRYLLHILGAPVPITRREVTNPRALFFTDPAYVYLLNCLEVEDYSGSLSSLAKVSGLARTRIVKVVQHLIEMGLVESGPAGTFRTKERALSSTDGVTNADIREHHKISLTLGIRAIEAIPVAERDITTTSFAAAKEKFEEIRAEIRQAHNKVIAIGQSAAKSDEVYRMVVAIYPYAGVITPEA